ncbi:chemotaxis protein CheB [Microcoleus sp. FACHB-672]|uniref:chemotaxis protein CheB n=1 Tax=Microcoleus sp. FACHB-672 TaxID=2692825 RepID=UPI001685E5A1|nr:chemotaxis protein CheB [Microcoleus sp. FACHB-672]MBD2040738.1 chemotaxis protein CheB [Microcoleus sp. FACHB-672]
MPGHDIIVIGASAGGVEALNKLVAGLPKDLPAALFIVLHIRAESKSFLPDILSRYGPLPAAHPKDHERIEHGRIYVAPPNYHLLVKSGYIRLVEGPKENSTRPAVDPLFRTAARAYGRRVVGVVLSGTLDDGTEGLIELKRRGGVAVVQDPEDALFSGMPSSAIEHANVDYILPLSSIAPALVRLAHEPVVEEGGEAVSNESDTDIVEVDGAGMRQQGHPGPASNFTCPDCGGTLFQLQDKGLLKFRCRVGHAYSGQTLVAGQSESQEVALWAAIRSLEERAELMHKMNKNARERNHIASAQRYEVQAKEAEQRADSIRQTLFQNQLPVIENPDEPTVSSSEGEVVDAAFKVVVLVGEAGGRLALSYILPALPANLPAAVIVVQRLDTQSDSSLMADAVSRSNGLPIKQAQEGEQLQPGVVYVAPPNEHLLVTPNGTFCLSSAVLVDFARPSADLLLQSVAASFKDRAITAILSGTGSDGASGVRAIHKMGGKTIAQDETTAQFFEMSSAAIATGTVDSILPLDEIASALVNLVMENSDE